jgi:hypothetical protein
MLIWLKRKIGVGSQRKLNSVSSSLEEIRNNKAV